MKDAREMWWDRLWLREEGEDPNRPSTWRLDALWRAACEVAAQEEADALLARPIPPAKPPQVIRPFPESIP